MFGPFHLFGNLFVLLSCQPTTDHTLTPSVFFCFTRLGEIQKVLASGLQEAHFVVVFGPFHLFGNLFVLLSCQASTNHTLTPPLFLSLTRLGEL